MATIYDGRRLEAREIRLLEICPGEWTHEIQCKLRFKSLDESRTVFETRFNYCCLSYVWGTEPRNIKIEVDGEAILITPNLDRAIRHYRKRMGAGNKRNIFDRLLWIDSVCINQEDEEELSRQVAMMNDIFALSRNTIIFLGDGLQPEMRFYGDHLQALADVPFKAFGRHEANDYELLNENGLLTYNRDSHMLYQMDATILLQFLEDVRHLPNGMHVSSILADLGNVYYRGDPSPIVIDALCRGFKHFTESRWWERAWTLQEAVAGRYCVFILGTSLTGGARSTPLFKYLDKFVEMVFSMNRSMSLYEIGSTQQGTSHEFDEYDFAMNELFGSFNRERSGLPFVADYLLRLLQKHRERHAADPRDKVFAVLPLAKWYGTSPIMYPSYAKSISEVYVDTTHTIISKSGYLDALAIAASTGGHPNFPSWVPDWSSHDNLDDNARLASLERYSATLDKTSDAEFDNNKLLVNAVLFGEVQYCGKTMAGKRPLWKTVHHWAQLAGMHINNLSPNSSKGPTSWKDFCRTIHGDMIFIDGMKHTYRLTVTLDNADLTWTRSSEITAPFPCYTTSEMTAAIEEFFAENVKRFNEQLKEENETSEDLPATSEFTLRHTTNKRSFFISDGNYFGLSPAQAKRGDTIAFLQGSRTPHMLRPVTAPSSSENEYSDSVTKGDERVAYRLIGDCYLHGFMDGELDNLMFAQSRDESLPETSRLTWKRIEII